MKGIYIISVALVITSAFNDFHSSYISKFKKTHDILPHIHQSSAICEKYLCSPSKLKPTQCVYSTKSYKYLQVCPAGSFCPWALNTHDNTTCVTGSDTIEYGGNPGDACSSNSDCGGLSFCNSNNVCQGGTTGDPCNDQPDCDVGYACHNVEIDSTCQPLLSLGKDCGNYLTMELCQNTLACNYGKCINLFSKANGAYVQEEIAGVVCESGFYARTTQPGQVVCQPAPKSPRGTLPIACDAGSYCSSSDGKYSVKCECGFNPNGPGYCPLFPGDDLYQNYLAALKSYMTDPNLNNCHYLDVGQPSCQSVSQAKYQAMTSLAEEVIYFVAKVGNDRCVKNIITDGYWN